MSFLYHLGLEGEKFGDDGCLALLVKHEGLGLSLGVAAEGLPHRCHRLGTQPLGEAAGETSERVRR